MEQHLVECDSTLKEYAVQDLDANAASGALTSVVIESRRFEGVHLRMDGRGKGSPNGFGKVNCQFGNGPWEQFGIVPHPDRDGSVAIVSRQFGTFLRMDARGLSPSADEGGIVNCQSHAGPMEKFRIEPHADGTVSIASVAFPGVFLRMDGRCVQQSALDGTGKVNCRFGARSMEKFRIVDSDENWNVRLVDVGKAFCAVKTVGEREQFHGAFPIENGGDDHIQGISSYRDYFFVVKNERSGERGTIVVLNKSSCRIVQRFATPTDGFRHPDGGQVIGAYLAQAVENGREGFVCFYDLGAMTDTAPPRLVPCRIECPVGAGAVGITDIGAGAERCYLVVVCEASSASFYKSNVRRLSDPSCAFEHLFTQELPPFPGDRKSKGANNVCLVTDINGHPHLVAFTSVDGILGRPAEDWASLYAVDVHAQRIDPLIQRHMATSSGRHLPVLDGVSFRWGAGLKILSPVQMEFFCTSRNFTFGAEAGLSINTFP